MCVCVCVCVCEREGGREREREREDAELSVVFSSNQQYMLQQKTQPLKKHADLINSWCKATVSVVLTQPEK